jgi:hypothetical protein
MLSLVNNVCTHITSAIAFAKALYSASILDLDIVTCLRAFQATMLLPWYSPKPYISSPSSTLTSNHESTISLKVDWMHDVSILGAFRSLHEVGQVYAM